MKISKCSISFPIGARCADKTGEGEEEEEEKAWSVVTRFPTDRNRARSRSRRPVHRAVTEN